MKRNHILQIRLSSEEFEQLEKKAERVGLTISAFARLIMLTAKIEVDVN